MRLIQPKLISDFRCLAAKCPSTCCKYWEIAWHKNEVNKLLLTENKYILEKIPFSFYEKCDEYLLIKHDNQDKCPFLLESGFCEIHKELGEDYLSYVCREYPRISRVCDNIVLRSCRTSCYVVMENICRNPDGMDIISSDTINSSAIISTEDDGKRRSFIFNNVRKELWDTEKIFHIYNNVDIGLLFTEIFGWEMIIAKTDDEKQHAKLALSEYCCKKFEDNLIKAVFLEWIINSFCNEYSDTDNLRCFDFCVNTIQLAVSGAACAANDREQFICTMCDFISFLLGNTKKIIIYLSQSN